MARFVARMRVLTREGPKVVEVRDPQHASSIGEHWNAVKHFLNTGDDSRLWPFEDETVEGETFGTDLDTIEEWARRAELDFEEIYEG